MGWIGVEVCEPVKGKLKQWGQKSNQGLNLCYVLYLPGLIQTIPVLLLQEVGGAAGRKGHDCR